MNLGQFLPILGGRGLPSPLVCLTVSTSTMSRPIHRACVGDSRPSHPFMMQLLFRVSVFSCFIGSVYLSFLRSWGHAPVSALWVFVFFFLTMVLGSHQVIRHYKQLLCTELHFQTMPPVQSDPSDPICLSPCILVLPFQP